MTLWCITNDVPDLRPCVIPNEHHEYCDGWEYRWSQDAREDVATGRPCSGCLPRQAQRGHVCSHCYELIQTAEATYREWFPMMHGVDRAVAPESGSARSIGYVPLSTLALDRDAIARARASHPGHLETWISTTHGAADAVRFALATRTAAKKHPTRENPHRITRTYCPACRRPTLIWRPPAAASDPVRVACADATCGHVVPDQSIDDISYIEHSVYTKGSR